MTVDVTMWTQQQK